jgi:hypothetical protein
MIPEKLANPFEQRVLFPRSHMTPSLDATRPARGRSHGRSDVRERASQLRGSVTTYFHLPFL